MCVPTTCICLLVNQWSFRKSGSYLNPPGNQSLGKIRESFVSKLSSVLVLLVLENDEVKQILFFRQGHRCPEIK